MSFRIAVLANRDVESCIALNLLHRALGRRIRAVYLSERVGGRTPVARALEPLGFIEQDFFARYLTPAAAAEPLGGRFFTFDECEVAIGVPAHVLDSARTTAGLDALRRADADLFLSVRFGHILNDPAIAIPRHGVLNLHSGLLPDYRGVLATFRALLNGDAEIGCTLHWIDSSEIDEGAVIGTQRIPVQPTQSLLWHILALYPPGIAMMARAALAVEAGQPLAAEAQVPGSGAYYSYPTADDVARFTAAGWRLYGRDDVEALAARFSAPPPPSVA